MIKVRFSFRILILAGCSRFLHRFLAEGYFLLPSRTLAASLTSADLFVAGYKDCIPSRTLAASLTSADLFIPGYKDCIGFVVEGYFLPSRTLAP